MTADDSGIFYAERAKKFEAKQAVIDRVKEVAASLRDAPPDTLRR